MQYESPVRTAIRHMFYFLLFAAVCVAGYFGWQHASQFGSAHSKTDKSVSPEGIYHVEVIRADPWVLGSSAVVIKGKDRSALLHTHRGSYAGTISDDGGYGEVVIEWLDDDTALVTLSGCEQEDALIAVDFLKGHVEIGPYDGTP